MSPLYMGRFPRAMIERVARADAMVDALQAVWKYRRTISLAGNESSNVAPDLANERMNKDKVGSWVRLLLRQPARARSAPDYWLSSKGYTRLSQALEWAM